MVYVVNIQYQGLPESIEVFESEQDAIDKFAETLKNAIPGIGHKVRHNQEDFWYVHWETLDELLDGSKYEGSQIYDCGPIPKTRKPGVEIITRGESITDSAWVVLRWPNGREIVVHYDGRAVVRRA